MTTFFFDVTGLVAYLRSNDRYSGIQRVVAMLVDRCTEQLGSQRARLAWNDGSLRGYRTVACGDLPDGALRDPDILSGVFGLGTTRGLRGERTLARYRSNKAKFLFHRAILDLEQLAFTVVDAQDITRMVKFFKDVLDRPLCGICRHSPGSFTDFAGQHR